MKARLRHFWRFIDEYILYGSKSEVVRARVLMVLEWGQKFFTRLPEAGKKKHRLLRRALPAAGCLMLGCFLFLSAHSPVLASPASASVGTQVGNIQEATGSAPKCPDTPAPNTSGEPLTGLPLPDPSGNTPCEVPIATTCSITATSQGDLLFGANGLLLASNNAPNNDSHNASELQPDWAFVLTAALALLAIPFALAGYQIMLGVASNQYAGAIEVLSRVILVALLAFLSYDLIQLLIQLESAISSDIYQAILQNSAGAGSQTVAVPTNNWCVNVQNFFGNLYNLTVYNMQNASRTLTGTSFSQKVYETTLNLINNLPTDILTLLTILLVIQLLIRLGLLNFYIILSPLAIICATLPGEMGRDAARGWVRGFLALLCVQLVQLLALALGSQLFPASLVGGSDWFNQALKELLPIVIMVITLQIPRLFNISSVNLLSTLSSSFGGAMSSVILIVRGF